jgi:hypothetical protein
MARKNTGTIDWRCNAKTGVVQWHAQLTLADGSRPFVPLDPKIPEHDKAAAQACARETSAYFRDRGAIVDRETGTMRSTRESSEPELAFLSFDLRP